MDRAKLISQAPVLMVSDIIKSIEYWTEKLGFTANTYGEPVYLRSSDETVVL